MSLFSSESLKSAGSGIFACGAVPPKKSRQALAKCPENCTSAQRTRLRTCEPHPPKPQRRSTRKEPSGLSAPLTFASIKISAYYSTTSPEGERLQKVINAAEALRSKAGCDTRFPMRAIHPRCGEFAERICSKQLPLNLLYHILPQKAPHHRKFPHRPTFTPPPSSAHCPQKRSHTPSVRPTPISQQHRLPHSSCRSSKIDMRPIPAANRFKLKKGAISRKIRNIAPFRLPPRRKRNVSPIFKSPQNTDSASSRS